MVIRVFNDLEINFLKTLGLSGADNSTMVGSFRDAFPENFVDDDRLRIKYGVLRRALMETTSRCFCIGCGKQVYLLEGETNCSECR